MFSLISLSETSTSLFIKAAQCYYDNVGDHMVIDFTATKYARPHFHHMMSFETFHYN